MCFAPQRRALFRHLNLEKWSGAGVFCTCFAPQWRTLFRHLVPGWGVLYILTWKWASRHNGRNFSFLICPDASAPAASASVVFDLPEPQNIEKTVLRDVLTFARTCIFSLLTFSLSDLLSSDFHLVWACSWLCFPFPYCLKFSFQTSFD